MTWGKEWKVAAPYWSNDFEEDVKNLKPTQIILILERSDGTPVSVAATIVGDLAVHDAIEGWGLRVTHVPTGTEFDKAVPKFNIPNVHDAKKALIEWCKKVQMEHSDDWAELRGLTPDNYEDMSYETKLRIRDWCLSVEV